MGKLKFSHLNKDNWEEAIELSVFPEQKRFVPEVAIGIAEAYVRPYEGEDIIPYVIVYKEKVIGFFLLHFPEDKKYFWLSNFLIDKDFQQKGFGKSALSGLLDYLKENKKCKFIGLTVHRENDKARSLYRKLGFKEVREVKEDNEVEYRRYFNRK